MESKKDFGKLSKVYRTVLMYILSVALISFVYKQYVLEENSIERMIPEIFMITLSIVILMIGLIRSMDGPGHQEEMGRAKHNVHLVGLLLVTIIGIGLHFYYENVFTQMGHTPYPYMSSGMISLGTLIYYVSLKRNGLNFNQGLIALDKRGYMHKVFRRIGYIFGMVFVYIMIVVFSGALLDYTRQGVNRTMICIVIIGLIFSIHYMVSSIYAKISYDDQQRTDEEKAQHMISKNIIMLFGVAAVYKIMFSISAHLVLRLQDYLNIQYNRLYDLMNIYFWTQYFEISYWVLMSVIAYLLYKALKPKITNEKIGMVMKILVILYPLYIMSQSFVTVFGAEIAMYMGILRYQQLLLNLNALTLTAFALGFIAGLFIYFVMRLEKLPLKSIFLAHVLATFLGKAAILVTLRFYTSESNVASRSGLLTIGLVILTSGIMIYYLIKLNNEKSNLNERVLLGGINYEHVRQ
ncbi:MAG: hypothetical protein A2Y43_03230 [Tenericutes bacterium GWA2_38_26]|nr:MAG: hypothetical protein A2Y43_03230 [Tenericutes bacterium GWA2_38_26]